MSRQTTKDIKTSLRWLNIAIVLAMVVSLIPFNISFPGPLPDVGAGAASAYVDSNINATIPERSSQGKTEAIRAQALAPAAIPASLPYVYFAPFPEEQVKQTFDTIQSNGSDYVSVVYIIAAEDNTVIVYDHWEDGYEPNIAQPLQASTRVFGDGNTANGNANTYCVNSNCPGDIVGAGDVLVLEPFQTITIPRNPSLIKFDGRDKFASNQRVGNGRSFWPLDAGPLFAGAEQFLSADEFGTTFVMPIGQDMSALSTQAFERVAAFIMPSQNQTNCTWNGAALNPMNQGQGVRRASVQSGDTLVCDKPVQVHLISGDVGSNYESRTFAIFGRDSWSNSYYDPVASVAGAYDDAVNYIYNPNGSTLQVRAETRFGTTNINVPANGVARYVKPDSAVHLYSANGKAFYAVNANDAASGDNTRNQAFDWGHALVPEGKLTDQVVTGWAPGSDGLAAPNGSPIWVTALAATTIYADFDQNGTADFSQAVQPLQSIRIYDNGDRDQSGIRVYTTNGTLITAAWGEDRSKANPARPNIDVGTVALPYRESGTPSLNKSVELLTDANSNGKFDPGDTARYTIVAANSSGSPVTGAVLSDALPAAVTYVGGSAKLNGGAIAPSTFPAGPLNLPNPASPPGTLPPGASYTIIFDVTVNAGSEGQTLINTATLTTDQATLNDDARFNVPDAPAPPVCGADILTRFTDNSGTDVSFVLVGGSLYVTVSDAVRTKNNGLVESVQATVTNLDGGDVESITLTETSASSNVFRNTTGLPVSENGGATAQDGTLNGRPGQDLQVEYTNDLWGVTCSDTSLVAGPSQTKTLYLDDPLSLSLNPTQDAYLLSVRPDENEGGSTSIVLSTINNGVIQFDLSSLPAGATIKSAWLELRRVSGTIDPSGDVIEVRGLTQSWVEGNQNTTAQACTDGVTWAERDCDANTTWTNAGGTYNGTVYATANAVTGVMLWDVTTLAQAWKSGSLTNNGLLLRLASGSKVHGFSSRTGTYPPVLHIGYSLAGETNQGLDRINPVTTGDNFTSSSVELGMGGSVVTTGLAAFAGPTDSPNLPFRSLWNGTSFGAITKEPGVNGLGNFRILQGAASPNTSEKIFVGVINSASNNVVGMRWNGSALSTLSINPLGTASETFWWGAEIAYERSGDALAVWNGGSNLKYSIWNGASWTAAANITSCTTGEPKQMRLAADPTSDEMVLVVNHASEVDCALVWSGSSWGNSVTLDNDTSQDRTDIYVAYESLSGDAMVVYNTNADQNMNYRIWNGSTWSSEATITAATDGSGPSGYARWAVMDSDPNSDRIVLGVQTSDPDGWVAVWNGGSWGASTLLTTGVLVLDAATAPNVAVAFESTSGEALATYGRSSQNVFFHRTWTSGGGWSSEVANNSASFLLGSNTNSMTLDRDPNSNQIMLMLQTDDEKLRYVLWNGSSWSTPSAYAITGTGETKNQPFAFVWSGNEAITTVPSTTFVQTLPMASDFVLSAGGLATVSTYINVTGGTMPASPNITAVLKKNNGTVLATLTNPSYSGGVLTWAGTTGAAQTVVAGEQIVLEITTAQSGVTFVIEYDSATRPSRIDLPTNTVIKIDDLAFYDAPYPLGNEISDATVGQTVFIRTTVSDPFGYADIVETTLDIDGTQIVLDPTYVVSQSGATKTYEYPWLTPPPATSACNDVYPVSVVADEGYETGLAAISASASTEIAVSCNDNGAPCAANFLDGLGGDIVSQYSGGDTIFMQLVDYDRIASSAITVTLNGVEYSLNQTGASTGIFQGADNTIAAGETKTMLYIDPTAAPLGSDMCLLDISAPDSANPGISVRKTLTYPSGGYAIVGGQVVFQIAVTNSGNQTLDPVQIVDTFNPTYLQFETADPAQSSTTANTITWNNVGPLLSGETTILEVAFTARETISPTVNSVVATGTPIGGGGNVNDSDSDDVRIAGPEVDVTKTTIIPADRQASVGDEVTFRIDIHNTGDLVIDILPMTDLYDTFCLAYVSTTETPDATAFGVVYWEDLTQNFGQNLAVDGHFIVDITMRVLKACNPAVNNAIVEGARAENPPGSGQAGGSAVPVVYDDDYVVAAATFDFGDAPNSYGTTAAANGPQHTISLFQPVLLGANLPDSESDGVPSANANSDDLNATPDDEDAFVTLPKPVASTTSYSLTVPVSNTTGITTTLYGWVDFDADGMFEASEGVTVAVPYNAGSALLSWSGVAITDTFGITTYVRLRITSDVLTDNGGTGVDERALGLASDGEVEDYAVAIKAPSMIGNQIWHDTDGDGLYEPGNGELGISGVTVDLWNDVDGNGVLNPLNDTLAMTTTTDANGGYLFLNAPSGNYLVRVSDDDNVLTGYLPTTGATPGADNNSQAQPYAIALPAGGANLTADFGYAQPVTIGDFIYFDSNGNGVQDPGETSGIDGVPITATNIGTGQMFNTDSDDGNYSFTNLPPGTYSVSVPAAVPGVTLTTNSPKQNTLLSGQSWLTADFGYISPTAVNIVSFAAVADAEGVLLRWQTSLEEDLEGFIILRALKMEGVYKAVSDLLPAMNDPFGTSYEWRDTGIDADSLVWYKLQAQPDGEVFGPIPSRDDPGSGGNNKLFIPMIVR